MIRSKQNTIFYIIVLAVAIIYIVTGMRKIIGVESVVNDFKSWGYAPLFMRLIGTLELLGAVGLLIPKSRIPAMGGLVGVMLGAIGTHIINGEYYALLLPTVLLLLLISLFLMSQDEIEEANLGEDDQVNY